MPMILFVCTANRYRSPIAEACFRRELGMRSIRGDWKVRSAGTWTEAGMPAASGAVSAARRMGLDITGHVSSMITGELMQQADLVLVMEQGQKEALRSEFPRSAQKVQLLSEVTTGTIYDIPDPAAAPGADEVPEEINELIHGGFERIMTMLSN